MSERYINPKNARVESQQKVMEQIARDGVCPFCKEHLGKYHEKPITHTGKWWVVTENMFPYKDTRVHLLFIHKEHITTISEVTPSAMKELFHFINAVVMEYDIQGGTFLWRFGDTKYNGSSVHHLHAQLVVGDIDDPNHTPVRVKIG